MPRKSESPPVKPVVTQWNAWWLVTGEEYEPKLHEWDPETTAFTQALLELLDDGLTIVLRPGSGGLSIGVALWKGDQRDPPIWFRDQDTLDTWTKTVTERASARREKKKATAPPGADTPPATK